MRGNRPLRFKRERVTLEEVTRRFDTLDADFESGKVATFKILDVTVDKLFVHRMSTVKYSVSMRNSGTRYYDISQRGEVIQSVVDLENIPLDYGKQA
jgi:hypothetical protein